MIKFLSFLTPINTLFIVIFLGLLLSKIKVYHLSLGLSGILFVAVAIGFFIKYSSLNSNTAYIYNLQQTMKAFSALGSSLFLSVIGVSTGGSLRTNTKGNLISLAIGICMTFAGVFTAVLIRVHASVVSDSTLLGILCGALTSTPALATVCERSNISTSDATMGYSCAYLIGVISTVLSVSFLFAKKKTKEANTHTELKNQGFVSTFCLLALTIVLGNLVGNLPLLETGVSLGTGCGVLLVGMMIGYLCKNTKNTAENILNLFRNFGLSLFFAGTGLCAGLDIIKISWSVFFFGLLITASSLLFGYTLLKVLADRTGLNISSVLAGGMTSSPALGVLTEKGKSFSTGQFSFAYFGALISLVIIVRFLFV